MYKKYLLSTFILMLVLLTGCGQDLDYEEEVVLVDQPKEKYQN